jgi:hypothetical protein
VACVKGTKNDGTYGNSSFEFHNTKPRKEGPERDVSQRKEESYTKTQEQYG